MSGKAGFATRADPRSLSQLEGNLNPGEVLRAAWAAGARRVHIDLTDHGAVVRSRVNGRLREVARFPSWPGQTLVELLVGNARNGIGGRRDLRRAHGG